MITMRGLFLTPSTILNLTIMFKRLLQIMSLLSLLGYNHSIYYNDHIDIACN